MPCRQLWCRGKLNHFQEVCWLVAEVSFVQSRGIRWAETYEGYFTTSLHKTDWKEDVLLQQEFPSLLRGASHSCTTELLPLLCPERFQCCHWSWPVHARGAYTNLKVNQRAPRVETRNFPEEWHSHDCCCQKEPFPLWPLPMLVFKDMPACMISVFPSHSLCARGYPCNAERTINCMSEIFKSWVVFLWDNNTSRMTHNSANFKGGSLGYFLVWLI